MLFHFTVGEGNTSATVADRVFVGLFGLGWTGVDLFFVLSGFLITGILLDEKHSQHYFRNFYARRALRIFPLYFTALLVWLVIAPRFAALVPELRLPPGSAPWAWAHATNIYLALVQDHALIPFGTGHFWSLSVEEQFYLIWPVLVAAFRTATLLRVCVAIMVLAEVARALLAFNLGNVVGAYTLMPARADTLAVGALTAICYRDPELMQRLQSHRRLIGLTCTAILCTVAVSRRTADTWLDAYDPYVQVLAYTPIACSCGLLILLSVGAQPDAFVRRALEWRGLRTLGFYSYGLYVVHLPIAKILKRLVVPSGTVPLVGGTRMPFQIALTCSLLLLSLAVAWLSYHTLERPFLRLKRLFRTPPPCTTITAAGASAPD